MVGNSVDAHPLGRGKSIPLSFDFAYNELQDLGLIRGV